MKIKTKILVIVAMVAMLSITLCLSAFATEVADGAVVQMTITADSNGYYDTLRVTPNENVGLTIVAYDSNDTSTIIGEYTSGTVHFSETANYLIIDYYPLDGTHNIQVRHDIGDVQVDNVSYAKVVLFFTGLTEVNGEADGVTIEILGVDDDVTGVTHVFTAMMGFLMGSINTMQGIFYNGSLTLIGALATIGVSIGVTLLIVYCVKRFLSLR